MPKRKRTISQDMGYDLGEITNQEKRRSIGLYPDHDTQPFIEMSPGDFMAEPQPFVEFTQADCKAEPDDAMDYKTVYGSAQSCCECDCDMDQYIDYSLCALPTMHPDVDLAMDNNYADESLFLPSDSNLTHGLPNTDVEAAYNPPSTPRKLIHITTPTGTITLTPSQRIYARSYYDEVKYDDPKSTDYKFTTAAQLLHPHAFDAVGWSPEHYAGLTNPIRVPRSAYAPRPKPSPSEPVRRTVLTSNRDLAIIVGYMRHPVTPMHQLGTGLVHPDFPTTWAGVALLTEEQMDDIAQFYHQTGGWNQWWLQYPCPVLWRPEDGVWIKRRKMMEFIGIRKPERPPIEVVGWLNDLEEEVQRRVQEERVREERREELRRKMWLCGGGGL